MAAFFRELEFINRALAKLGDGKLRVQYEATQGCLQFRHGHMLLLTSPGQFWYTRFVGQLMERKPAFAQHYAADARSDFDALATAEMLRIVDIAKDDPSMVHGMLRQCTDKEAEATRRLLQVIEVTGQQEFYTVA